MAGEGEAHRKLFASSQLSAARQTAARFYFEWGVPEGVERVARFSPADQDCELPLLDSEIDCVVKDRIQTRGNPDFLVRVVLGRNSNVEMPERAQCGEYPQAVCDYGSALLATLVVLFRAVVWNSRRKSALMDISERSCQAISRG